MVQFTSRGAEVWRTDSETGAVALVCVCAGRPGMDGPSVAEAVAAMLSRTRRQDEFIDLLFESETGVADGKVTFVVSEALVKEIEELP